MNKGRILSDLEKENIKRNKEYLESLNDPFLESLSQAFNGKNVQVPNGTNNTQDQMQDAAISADEFTTAFNQVINKFNTKPDSGDNDGKI